MLSVVFSLFRKYGLSKGAKMVSDGNDNGKNVHIVFL